MCKSIGRKPSFILALLLAFSLPVFSQSVSPSSQTVTISSQNWNELNERIQHLETNFLALSLKVQNLQKNSVALTKLSDALKLELENSLIQIEGLQTDITNLKAQLAESLDKSKKLETDLALLEKSYESLYDSFLDYQKKAEVLLKTEKAKTKLALIFLGVTTALSFVFGGLWGIEHFLIK